MDCREAGPLIAGLVDRELDPRTEQELTRHLETCDACSGVFETENAVSRSLREALPYFETPAGLAGRIRNTLPQTADGVIEDAPRPRFVTQRIARGFALAAALVLVAIVFYRLGRIQTVPAAAAPLLARQVLACHVRSLMADHLMDVVSTDKHTVKPWYTGRLDFSPPVDDLKASGYPLIGGRMEYVDGHPAAGLVYKFRKHIINVFVWPAAGSATEPAATTIQGYNIETWTGRGMTWWAVSDMNAQDLRHFADLLEHAEDVKE